MMVEARHNPLYVFEVCDHCGAWERRYQEPFHFKGCDRPLAP